MILWSTAVRVTVFMLVFFASFVYLIPKKYDVAPLFAKSTHRTNVTTTSSTFNASMIAFWRELSTVVVDATPLCPPLGVDDSYVFGKEGWFQSLEPDQKPLQRLKEISQQSEIALLRAHYRMRRAAQRLAPKLPFAAGTTGIATTTNAENLPVLMVSLRMIRRTGCSLPIEVFLDNWASYSHETCEIVLPRFNARCIILSALLSTSNATETLPLHTTHKPNALLFSSFQHVLYMDADAFPTYDPTVLLSTPPYTTHGMVTWPDTSGLTVSPHFYHIAALPPEPPASRRSSISSHLLLNKAIHAPTLLLALYYNAHGPRYFYPLLAQSAHPASEKETYVHAALVLGLPVYNVKSPPSTLGRWWNDTYRTVGLASADPGMDAAYLPPYPSPLHPSPLWTAHDLAHPNATLEHALNYTRVAPVPPRPVFLHQFGLKLDPKTILGDKGSVAYEPDGTRARMWGLRGDVVYVLGYDVEERLWGAIVEEGCWREGDTGGEVCKGLVEWAGEVVDWMGSVQRPW